MDLRTNTTTTHSHTQSLEKNLPLFLSLTTMSLTDGDLDLRVKLFKNSFLHYSPSLFLQISLFFSLQPPSKSSFTVGLVYLVYKPYCSSILPFLVHFDQFVWFLLSLVCFSEYMFADVENLEHYAKYLNQSLITFGFPASLDLFTNDPVRIELILLCLSFTLFCFSPMCEHVLFE